MSNAISVIVVDYDPQWLEYFEKLQSFVWPVISDIALSIEHVGSTSVPGLAAKPIIDISVVLPTEAEIPTAIERLATLGYVHRGNLGIEGREAFYSPAGLPKHHLYACPRDSGALANHLSLRDYLRTHPEAVREYGALKKRLAQEFPNDIDSYIEGKTALILQFLEAAGLPQPLLEAIEQANRKPA